MVNDLIKCRSPQLCEKLLDNQQAGGKHGSIKAHGNSQGQTDVALRFRLRL